ncbi:MAG: hypothetical protein PUB32_05695 [Clostridiales bacterium]|nr:hypothetical protein [Clostridiales bacterium]
MATGSGADELLLPSDYDYEYNGDDAKNVGWDKQKRTGNELKRIVGKIERRYDKIQPAYDGNAPLLAQNGLMNRSRKAGITINEAKERKETTDSLSVANSISSESVKTQIPAIKTKMLKFSRLTGVSPKGAFLVQIASINMIVPRSKEKIRNTSAYKLSHKSLLRTSFFLPRRTLPS